MKKMLSRGERLLIKSPQALARNVAKLANPVPKKRLIRNTEVSTVEKAYSFTLPPPKNMKVLVLDSVFSKLDEIMALVDQPSNVFVFTDETVYGIYGARFEQLLRSNGYIVNTIILPDGEESKSIANYVYLVDRVMRRNVDEKSLFVSLGGGVVCNVCGFIASTIYRGMSLMHIPTTLMSQCDAAISHKQGINSHMGKNMIGSYFAPNLIVVDPTLLSSMPSRRISDGLAEVIKHGLGQDARYADMLSSYSGSMESTDFLRTVIRKNIELKQALLATDPFERHEGMVLHIILWCRLKDYAWLPFLDWLERPAYLLGIRSARVKGTKQEITLNA